MLTNGLLKKKCISAAAIDMGQTGLVVRRTDGGFLEKHAQ